MCVCVANQNSINQVEGRCQPNLNWNKPKHLQKYEQENEILDIYQDRLHKIEKKFESKI